MVEFNTRSQQVKIWTALWMDHRRVQYKPSASENLDYIMDGSWEISIKSLSK
jgi:hypothetical protein